MPSPYNEFARRLHHALDEAGFEKGRGRTAALATRFNVSRETARKWLTGLALPELERMMALALFSDVSFEWLATGRGSLRGGLRVEDEREAYGDADEQQLIGLVRRMSPVRRRAWLTLLAEGGN